MYTKIQIVGKLEVKTGMHIGGSSAFSTIGAVDSPVIKDLVTNLPMIPGSSLKGKMRTLLAKAYNTEAAKKPDEDCERLTRLFGSAKKGHIKRARILISDMILKNEKQLRDMGLQSMTEVKFENSIHRISAIANPRQIERVIRGSSFDFDIIYEMEQEDEFLEDMETIGQGLRLLEYDYIGGSGSRGYGKIAFQDVEVEVVIGEVDENLMDQCYEILSRFVQLSNTPVQA